MGIPRGTGRRFTPDHRSDHRTGLGVRPPSLSPSLLGRPEGPTLPGPTEGRSTGKTEAENTASLPKPVCIGPPTPRS